MFGKRDKEVKANENRCWKELLLDPVNSQDIQKVLEHCAGSDS